MKGKLTGALIGLARATFGNEYLITEQTNQALLEGLLAEDCSDMDTLSALIDRVENEKRKLIPLCYECAMPCGKNNAYDMSGFYSAEQDIRDLKAELLRQVRALAERTTAENSEQCRLICRGLFAVGEDEWDAELLRIVAVEVTQTVANG